MKFIAMTIALLASATTYAQVAFVNSADLSTSTINHTIVDAEYKEVATQVTTRRIPGCAVHSEN